MRAILGATRAASNGARTRPKDPADKRMLIRVAWVAAESGAMMESIDPASGKVIQCFPDTGAADIDRAVAATRMDNFSKSVS